MTTLKFLFLPDFSFKKNQIIKLGWLTWIVTFLRHLKKISFKNFMLMFLTKAVIKI